MQNFHLIRAIASVFILILARGYASGTDENFFAGHQYKYENITRYFELKELECLETRVRLNIRRRQIQDKRNEFCRDAEGKRTLANEIDR